MREQMSDADIVAKLGEVLKQSSPQRPGSASDMVSKANAAAEKFAAQEKAAADAEALMRGSENRRMSTKAIDVQVAVEKASVHAQTVIAQNSQNGAQSGADASVQVTSATQQAQAAATAGHAADASGDATVAPVPATA